MGLEHGSRLEVGRQRMVVAGNGSVVRGGGGGSGAEHGCLTRPRATVVRRRWNRTKTKKVGKEMSVKIQNSVSSVYPRTISRTLVTLSQISLHTG